MLQKIMLPKPFKEFIELLERNQVRYLVVGGYAVSLHGYPRYTGDLDIFIAIDPKNSRGILKTFRDFGFTDLEIFFSRFPSAWPLKKALPPPVPMAIMKPVVMVAFVESFAPQKPVSVEKNRARKTECGSMEMASMRMLALKQSGGARSDGLPPESASSNFLATPETRRVNRLPARQPRREKARRYDETASGMLFYGFRFYAELAKSRREENECKRIGNPETGRWLNREPIEEAGGLKLYGFGGNDGVNRVAVLGLFLGLTRDIAPEGGRALQAQQQVAVP